MTSFLTDVLITAGELEKVNLDDKVTKVQKEVTKLKDNVRTFMDDNYIEFASKLQDDEMLVSKAKKLINEMSSLEKKINKEVKIQLSGLTGELKALSRVLKESNVSLRLSYNLLVLHECIKSITALETDEKYMERAKALHRMRRLLDDASNDLRDLDVYSALRDKYRNLYGLFLSDISTMWSELILWNETVTSVDGSGYNFVIKDDPEIIKDFFSSLYYSDNLADYLNRFCASLMQKTIHPMLTYHCSVYVLKEAVFIVEVLDRRMKPAYKNVLYNLKLLFKFLHRNFNISIDKEKLISRLKPYLLNQLSDTLVSNCISRLIPSNSLELMKFEDVTKAIDEFQAYLIEIGFISKDELFLSEYTKNVDKLFIDKMCIDFLAKAKTITKKDLHDSIEYNPAEPKKFPYNETYYSTEMEKALSESSFELPKCQISKSAIEILQLARTILEEIRRCPETCITKLFYTCRNVFELYIGLSTEHHKKLLEVIPQQVALFHNNCMYLAHNLLTLAYEHCDGLPKPLRKLNLTFADQSIILRNVGSEYFLNHMKYQRNIITDILKESGLAALGQSSQLHPSTERALRQCIRQIELLRSVWSEVLPTNVYCKAIGCITDSMIEDIIIRVVTVEDIPADVASELVTLFSMVENRIPPIFPDTKAIHQYVRRWTKFLELIKILGASLKEIEMRWTMGKGPLAREFLASEVKQLVRALFQNTERRSALLASIK